MQLESPIYSALHKYTKVLSVAFGYRDLLTRLHSERVPGLVEEMRGRGCPSRFFNGFHYWF